MFDDPEKALKRLEEQLLEEDFREAYPADDDAYDDLDDLGDDSFLLEEEEESEDAIPLYRNYSNDYGRGVRNFANGYGRGAPAVRQPEPCPEEAETEMDAVFEEPDPPEKGLRRLIVLACLLTLGILSIAVYWLVMLL